jgi:hypothetical protein
VLVTCACNPRYSRRQRSGGLQFKASLGKEFCETLSQKNPSQKGRVEWLKVLALSSNPSTKKKMFSLHLTHLGTCWDSTQEVFLQQVLVRAGELTFLGRFQFQCSCLCWWKDHTLWGRALERYYYKMVSLSSLHVLPEFPLYLKFQDAIGRVEIC